MIYILSYIVCIFYGILYNLRGYVLFASALGGVVARLMLNSLDGYGYMISFFSASLAVAIYGEMMARISKVPVMIYTIIGILPIIPGRGIYKAMATLYQGDINSFTTYGLETLEMVGAMVMGLMLTSSIVRIFKIRKLLKMFYLE